MGRFRWLMLPCMLLMLLLSGCSTGGSTYQEGYYTAEAAEFDDYGWKEYVTIFVSDARIVTTEYDARNSVGFIKSWDMDYMREMNAVDGTYPNEYTRQYAAALVSRQNTAGVDVITGATHSHDSFQLLADAAIARAKEGDHTVAYVELPKPVETPVDGL